MVSALQFWSPQPDRHGHVYAQFRFLPGVNRDQLSLIAHEITLPGRQPITVLCTRAQCQVCQIVGHIFDKGNLRHSSMLRSRVCRIISNVAITDDSVDPCNNGLVRLYATPWTIWYQLRKFADFKDLADIEAGRDIVLQGQLDKGSWHRVEAKPQLPSSLEQGDSNRVSDILSRRWQLDHSVIDQLVDTVDLDQLITMLIMAYG